MHYTDGCAVFLFFFLREDGKSGRQLRFCSLLFWNDHPKMLKQNKRFLNIFGLRWMNSTTPYRKITLKTDEETTWTIKRMSNKNIFVQFYQLAFRALKPPRLKVCKNFQPEIQSEIWRMWKNYLLYDDRTKVKSVVVVKHSSFMCQAH